MKATYIKSAVNPKDYPTADRPEVALLGRSNAGKSSLLNAIAGSKAAKVSQTPGKTRLLNFFDFGGKYRFVDMPGYGYAARSGSEILGWQTMITDYFEARETLKGVVLIMDARRQWQDEERWLHEWCGKLGKPLMVVLNKSDKFTRGQQAKALSDMKKQVPGVTMHMVSAAKNIGVEELEEDIFQRFVLGVNE
jgi:GTP-binding protein